MRIYLVGDGENEIIVDLRKTLNHCRSAIAFECSLVKDQALVEKKKIFVRKLANSYYISENNRRWEKIARSHFVRIILNVQIVYKVYRGYKPSQLFEKTAAHLVTKMPGKVIAIMKNVGERVICGEAVIIVEAMKMENEIKSNIDGIIKKIHVSIGQTLKKEVLMIEIEEDKI